MKILKRQIPIKFCIGDSNRCRIVCVKFYLNWCRFPLVIAKCLGSHFLWTQCTFKKTDFCSAMMSVS